MDNQDWKKTTLITHRGVFAFKNMLFGLINAGSTSRWWTPFSPYKSIETCRSMSMILSESHKRSSTTPPTCGKPSRTLDVIKLRLNPTKYSFKFTFKKFLWFLLTQWGIEVDPLQIKEKMEMKDPTNLKEVQVLTRYITTLRRFIRQSSKRCIPFFQVINATSKHSKIDWNEEYPKC